MFFLLRNSKRDEFYMCPRVLMCFETNGELQI